jgi:hypothetical protein
MSIYHCEHVIICIGERRRRRSPSLSPETMHFDWIAINWLRCVRIQIIQIISNVRDAFSTCLRARFSLQTTSKVDDINDVFWTGLLMNCLSKQMRLPSHHRGARARPCHGHRSLFCVFSCCGMLLLSPTNTVCEA